MEWISVDERLPNREDMDLRQDFLCLDADGDEYILYYDTWGWSMQFPVKGTRTGYDVLVVPEALFAFPITHWMPLPEPPREDE